ncbi:MAG: lysostaphin resistance A-like protein, partial [Planctomycetota bacterium]
MTGRQARTMYAVIALITFFVAIASRSVVFRLGFYNALYRSLPEVGQSLEQPVRWLVLVLVGLLVAHRLALRRVPKELGLIAPFHVAMLFTFIATLPMLVVPLVLGKLASDVSVLDLLFYAGVWPLAEEILYRGYAFRQLHRRAGWNLWLAAVTTGVVFGAAHLLNTSVQGLPAVEQLGTVALIGVGGILYAWLFARWEDNLWVPFGMHMFMNL